MGELGGLGPGPTSAQLESVQRKQMMGSSQWGLMNREEPPWVT